MSIYESENKISHIIDFNEIDDEFEIATYKTDDEFKSLKFKNYSVSVLEGIVKTYPDAKINYKFWNYNFCNKNNIKHTDITTYIDHIDTTIYEKYDFFLGSIISLTYFYNIVYNVYTLNEKAFSVYYNTIPLSHSFLVDNFVKSRKVYPLNDNLLFLINKIFTDETINKFIYRYDIDSIKKIMKDFKIVNIHTFTFLLFQGDIDEDIFLQILYFAIEKYDNTIDTIKIVDIKDTMDHVGYNFLNLDFEMNELYIDIYKLLQEYNCCFKFNFKDSKMRQKINNRINLINDIIKEWS